MKRWCIAGLTLILAVLPIAGCRNSNNTDGGASMAPTATVKAGETPKPSVKPDPVTLKIMLPGDRPADMDQVVAEAEKRMADTLNIKLDIVFIPFADFGSKSQVTLASGEKVDLVFDAPWMHLNQFTSDGYYAELDDLLQKYGSEVLKTRPKEMWDANKLNGKIMAIPLGNAFMQGSTYMVRKDLREKLGLAPIRTYEELVQFEYAVKEKVPNVIPFAPAGSNSPESVFRVNWDSKTNIRYVPGIPTGMIYFKNNDGVVYNMVDKMEPKVWEWILNTRKLYSDKIINQDVLATKDPMQLLTGGKVAVMNASDFGVRDDLQAAIKKNIPGAELEAVTFFDTTPKVYASSYKMWNFLAVPAGSKNKERAVQFLNWANQKDNFDLLAYGIKGKNWEPVGDDRYKALDGGYPWFPYAWIWNPVHDRLNASMSNDVIALNKLLGKADQFTVDKATGFNFDPTPVSNEMTQIGTLQTKLIDPILNGVVDPEKEWPKVQKEAGPILKKIQEEVQKQFTAFLAKTK